MDCIEAFGDPVTTPSHAAPPGAADVDCGWLVDDARIAVFTGVIPAEGLSWQVVTPRLPAGTNLFRLAWTEDGTAGRRLEIRRFRLLALDPDEAFIRAAWLSATPAAQESSVDFPAPLPPSRQKISCRHTVSVAPRSTSAAARS